MKVESKPTVDSLFVRLGDGMAALTVLASSHVAGHATEVLIAVNLVLVVLWLVTAMVVVREHGRLVAARTAETAARLVPALRRTTRAWIRRARRAACTVFEAPVTLWDAGLALRLALLPIGRGHPPPMLVMA